MSPTSLDGSPVAWEWGDSKRQFTRAKERDSPGTESNGQHSMGTMEWLFIFFTTLQTLIKPHPAEAQYQYEPRRQHQSWKILASLHQERGDPKMTHNGKHMLQLHLVSKSNYMRIFSKWCLIERHYFLKNYFLKNVSQLRRKFEMKSWVYSILRLPIAILLRHLRNSYPCSRFATCNWTGPCPVWLLLSGHCGSSCRGMPPAQERGHRYRSTL